MQCALGGTAAQRRRPGCSRMVQLDSQIRRLIPPRLSRGQYDLAASDCGTGDHERPALAITVLTPIADQHGRTWHLLSESVTLPTGKNADPTVHPSANLRNPHTFTCNIRVRWPLAAGCSRLQTIERFVVQPHNILYSQIAANSDSQEGHDVRGCFPGTFDMVLLDNGAMPGYLDSFRLWIPKVPQESPGSEAD